MDSFAAFSNIADKSSTSFRRLSSGEDWYLETNAAHAGMAMALRGLDHVQVSLGECRDIQGRSRAANQRQGLL